MQVQEKELFHQFYGPFSKSVVVILEDQGKSFRLSFDEGPKYNLEAVLKSNVTAFKFAAGTIFEIRVSVLYGRKLMFQGTQIPTPSRSLTTSLREIGPGEIDPGDPLEPRCASISCVDDLACPDPTKPVLLCLGGVLKCTES